MSEMVERVAQELERRFEWRQPTPEAYRTYWTEIARAAIAAMREPTEEMLSRGHLAVEYDVESFKVHHCWQRMIDAAIETRTDENTDDR